MSDIELASYLLPPGLIERFARGDFTLIPLPGNTFGLPRPFFYYYFEVYPSEKTGGTSSFIVERKIIDHSTNRVIDNGIDTLVSGPERFANLDSVSLNALNTGTYSFLVEITDENENTVEKSSVFYIHRPDLDGQELTVFDLDSAGIEQELQEIMFLMQPDNMKPSKNATIEEKSLLLQEFWRKYDDDPSTALVPMRKQFKAMIADADQRYNTSRRRGHQTDRGRIYFHYGDPDTKEIFPLELNAKPYEVWSYDQLEGGVFFVFVDRSGRGEFSLAHSTKRGEIYHPTWYEDYIVRSGLRSRR